MKTQIKLAALAFSLLSAISFQHSAFAQGGLTPPGAPAPLFKTLQQVEPRIPISSIPITLSNSGSYYLTSNLTQTTNFPGITIGANDITVDLNGFALIGTNGTAAGITRAGAPRTNIWVRNGTIRNWNTGVSMSGAGDSYLEHLHVAANSGQGIVCVDNGTVFACVAIDNGSNGINTAGSDIRNCLVAKNGGHGIVNTGAGLIQDCMVNANSLDGIQVASGSLVVGNNVVGPGASGTTNAAIHVTGSGNRIENNHLQKHDTGVLLGGNLNFVFRNTTVIVTTNYSIPTGNAFGPTNTGSGVVTNHPWANFHL